MAPFLALSVSLCLLSLGFSMPLEDSARILPNHNSTDNYRDEGDIIDFSHLGNSVYGVPSRKTGQRVAEWTEKSLVNPEELGEYAEGDILIPSSSLSNFNGIKMQSSRWPGGVIPYVIEGRYTQNQQAIILNAMADYHRLTCIRFVPRTNQRDYVTIQNTFTGCWSAVGRTGGPQQLNLQAPGCVHHGVVVHELMHAVGFLHEHSRSIRDDYVTIHYENVISEMRHNFKKSTPEMSGSFGAPYDYASIMHYDEYAFSDNRQRTMVPKDRNAKIGQRQGFSQSDLYKINTMYRCRK